MTEQARDYLPPSYSLTSLGKHFLASGGFEYEKKTKEWSLKANRFARHAIMISVIVIILSKSLFAKTFSFPPRRLSVVFITESDNQILAITSLGNVRQVGVFNEVLPFALL